MSQVKFILVFVSAVIAAFFAADRSEQVATPTRLTPTTYKSIAGVYAGSSAYMAMIRYSDGVPVVWDAYASAPLYDVTLPVSGDTARTIAQDPYTSGFLVGTSGGRIYTLAPATGSLTLIATISSAQINRMCVRTSDGRIYVSNGQNNSVSAVSRAGSVGPTVSTSYPPYDIAFDADTATVVVLWTDTSDTSNPVGNAECLDGTSLSAKGVYAIGQGLASVATTGGFAYLTVNSQVPTSEIRIIDLASIETVEDPTAVWGGFIGPIAIATSPNRVHVYDTGSSNITLYEVGGPNADPTAIAQILCAGKPTHFAGTGSPGGGGDGGWPPANNSVEGGGGMFALPDGSSSTYFAGVLGNLLYDPEHGSGSGGVAGVSSGHSYGATSAAAAATGLIESTSNNTIAFACNNGDPIEMNTGAATDEVGIVRIADVGIPISVGLQYNNQTKYNGPFGLNWRHSYDDSLSGDTQGNLVSFDEFLHRQTYVLETSTGIYKGPAPGSDWITIDNQSIPERYVRMSKYGLRRAYNSSGKLTSITDRNGNVQTLLYRCSKLTYVVGPTGRWVGFSYNDANRVIAVTDFTGRAWSFEYDSVGRLDKVIRPPISGVTTPTETFEYAADVGNVPSDNLYRHRDANNAIIFQNTYDTTDRVVSQLWGGNTATLSYAVSNGISETTYTQFDGTVIIYRFDTTGELIEEVLYTRGVRSSEPTSYSKTYTFGSNGLHSVITHPSGMVEEMEYDARGNVTTQRTKPSLMSSSSIEISTTYSSNFNLPLTRTDEMGAVTSYTYDSHGNLTRVDYPSVTVPQSQSAHSEYTYNAQGQVLQMQDEEGRKTTFSYSASGPNVGFLLETKVEPTTGVFEVASLTVDSLGRTVASTTPWGATRTRTFNKWDLVATETTPSGATTTYAYDGNGRPLSVTAPNKRVDGSAAPGATTYTTTFEHEVRGYITKVRSEVAASTFAEVNTTYSPLGDPATITDANGKVVRFDYDERGFLWRTRHAYGTSDVTTETQDYDLDGRVVRRVDARGNISAVTYDEYGRATKIESPGRGYVSNTLNDRGDVTSSMVFDSLGTTSGGDDVKLSQADFLFDERGRPYGVNALVSGTTFAQSRIWRDKSGRPTQSVTPTSQVATIEYDGAGRLIATRDALSNKTARAITNGRVVAEAAYDRVGSNDVLVAQSNLAYDTDGNLASITQLPIGGSSGTPSRVTSTAYDVDGRPLTVVDPLSHETRFAYDGLGRMVSRTRPHNTGTLVETFAFDFGGRMTSRTDSASETVSFAYDHLNRRTSATYPGSKVETFVHDANGNLTRWTDRNGTIVDQTFDVVNRLTGRTITAAQGVLGATSESFTYDAADRLLTATNNAGGGHTTSQSFDMRGTLLSQTQDSRTVSYGYDLDGARTSRTAPSGRGLGYSRDALKRVTAINGTSPTSSTLLTSTWTGAGRKTAGTFGNGVAWTRTYDAYLRQISETHALSSVTVMGRGYGLDLADNVTSVSFSPEGTYDFHSVDDLDRVTSSTLFANAPTNPTAALGTLGVTLDGRGNRSQTAWTPWGSSNPTTTTYTGGLESSYSAVGGASYTYDNNGNVRADGVRTYAYDWANHLIEVRDAATTNLIASYEYDALGRRAKKQTYGTNAKTSVFVYDGAHLMEEYDGQGTRVAHFVHGDGVDRPAVIETASSTYYCHLDRLGSVAAITDAAGALVERYYYGPNGETVIYNAQGTPVSASTVGNPFGFTGQVYDTETGLYHFRARAYSPTLGRFLQLDPAGFVDGMNRYQYAIGNPLAFTDPSGCVRREPEWWKRFCKKVETFAKGAAAGINPTDPALLTVSLVSGSASGPFAPVTAAGAYLAGIACQAIAGGSAALTYESAIEAGASVETATTTSQCAGVIGGFLSPSMTLQNLSKAPSRLQDLISRALNWRGRPQPNMLRGLDPVPLQPITFEPPVLPLPSPIGGTTISTPTISIGLTPVKAFDFVTISKKIYGQMITRGWTLDDILRARTSGATVPAVNFANGNPATRYVHPESGQSVVIDNITGQVVQVGGPGFKFGPGSGDLP